MILYIPPLNCYLIGTYKKIYRKDIDDEPPYAFMDITSGRRAGACFRYSLHHKRLIINKDFNNISVINLESKVVEIEIEKSFGKQIADFRLFGKDENRVISVTQDKYLILHRLDFPEKKGSLIFKYDIEYTKNTEEQAKSIAVCDKSQYVLVEIRREETPFLCSRMLVFKVGEKAVLQTRCIDLLSQNIGFKYALECIGYVDKYILWAGLSKHREMLQIFYYDRDTEELGELKDLRVNHREVCPYKLQSSATLVKKGS